MSKITVKSTKEQMTRYLNEVFKAVQKADKNLADRIGYTAKAYKKDPAGVMEKDLYDLCKEAMALNLAPATPVVAEASIKPVKKTGGITKVKKEAEPVKEEATETPKEAPAETPKKVSGNKAVTKKSAKKDETPIVTPAEPNTKSEKEVPLAKMFKEKIESPVLGTLEIAHDIKTFKDLRNAVEKEGLLVFAVYWTKRMIKQFNYGANLKLKSVPASFKDDVDLATLIYIGEVNDIAYAVSSDTDGVYNILPDNLVEVDGLRFTDGGCEYQIYRQTAEPKAE